LVRAVDGRNCRADAGGPAARRPDLIRLLILMSASADPEPPEALPKYRLMNIIARWFGPRPVAGRLQPILFSQSVLTDPARAADVAEWRARLLALPPEHIPSRLARLLHGHIFAKKSAITY
jgi:pimeloyl-ACP methyl ester carboxylesterase